MTSGTKTQISPYSFFNEALRLTSGLHSHVLLAPSSTHTVSPIRHLLYHCGTLPSTEEPRLIFHYKLKPIVYIKAFTVLWVWKMYITPHAPSLLHHTYQFHCLKNSIIYLFALPFLNLNHWQLIFLLSSKFSFSKCPWLDSDHMLPFQIVFFFFPHLEIHI